VNVTAVPTVPVVGPAIVTASGRAAIVIVAEAVAVIALPSVTVTERVLDPLTEYVVLKLAPVPLAGEPPVAVQLNEYGVVPPVADAVNVTAVPTVPVVGPVTEAVRVSAAMVIVADPLAVWDGVAESVPTAVTVLVPLTL